MVRASDILLILVAILLPPAAVLFITGCSCDLLINFGLTLLGYIPGHVHAFYLIYKKMKAEEQHGYEAITYQGNGEFVPKVQPPQYGGGQPQAPLGAQTYGTMQ